MSKLNREEEKRILNEIDDISLISLLKLIALVNKILIEREDEENGI